MVGRIFAVAGLSGAGKSTAVSFLAETCGGEIIYFGDTVLRVVRERGLAATSENEQVVRVDLRNQYGAAYLVMREDQRIRTILLGNRSVVVDAVYVAEEYDYLAKLVTGAKLTLIGIETSFDTRLERVKLRTVRPLTEQQLRERDAVEMKKLNTGRVLSRADFCINNDASMEDFEGALRDVLRETGPD